MDSEKLRVVVFDSEPIVLATIATYLNDAGHHVQVGESILEHVERLSSSLDNADVVMVEAHSGNTQDDKIIEHLTTNYPHISIIVMQDSGFNHRLEGVGGQETAKVLRKPIRLSELETLLSRLGEGQRGGQ